MLLGFAAGSAEAALDSDRGRSDRAGFATVVLTVEPLGTAARSIKRKIFSLSPTNCSIRELTVVCDCDGFTRISRLDAGHHRQGK